MQRKNFIMKEIVYSFLKVVATTHIFMWLIASFFVRTFAAHFENTFFYI